MGIVFGFIYYYSGNIWYSVIAHFSSNALVFTINFITNITNAQILSMQMNWLYILIAFVGLIAFGIIMFFIFKFMKKTMSKSSVFSVDELDVHINLIEERLVEKESDLKYVQNDGVIGFKKSRKEQNKQAIVIGIVAMAFLFIILFTDLATYI